MSAPKHITPQELAERWGLKPSTLADWRVQGRGPRFFKPGQTPKARVRYRLEEIEDWERRNQHENTGELSRPA